MADIRARRDDGSAPFFDGAAHGRLVIKRCVCGHHAAPDRLDCPVCENPRFTWVEADGRATLVSWIVTHSRKEAADNDSRGVIGLVELNEGPWMYAALVHTAGVELCEGTPLTVEFVPYADGETVPVFSPLGARHDGR